MSTKVEAQTSIKSLHEEAFSLNPSALIELFEIDCTTLALDYGLITNITSSNDPESCIYRFHNNIKISSQIIYWQGNPYVAAPIQATGFEMNTRGTLPTPKLSISVAQSLDSNEGISALSNLKTRLSQLGDLVGAKVTRRRTLAKFLDANNFIDQITPDEFEPDENAEFPKDVYFVDRKSKESKNFIELELASILDVEGVKLPFRQILSEKCPFNYRGSGCHYEYAGRRIELVHGTSSESTLPNIAPPVANRLNEDIKELLVEFALTDPDNISLKDRGEWSEGTTYNIADTVYITKSNLRYYFVSKTENIDLPPPNTTEWIAEECSKDLRGCKLRWGGIGNGYLRGGFFRGVNRLDR